MSYLLLTNDDGVDSPALVPLARALATLAPVRIVVPDGERSWIAKAISRWKEVHVRTVRREELEIEAVAGYPADCTNLGVHSLFDGPPEMVVAGVNIGLNTGLGFFLSSGTVGAAMEGWIAGVPAVAFSVGVPEDDRAWKQRIAQGDFETLWPRAAGIAVDIIRTVRDCGFPPDVDLLNINFPVRADMETPRVITRLATVGYERLFRRREDGVFVHDASGSLRQSGELDGTDVAVVREGRVSITPVRLAHAVPLDPTLQRRLERS
ncbi:MAG: 5'/3'-nucleotidase SurE [Myxococcota bacterium]